MPAVVIPDYPIIRDLALGTEAHYSEDMAGWRSVPTRRGDGVRLAPQVNGGFPRPVYTGPIRFLHEVIVSGLVDPDGAAYGNPAVGLDTNLDLLYEACAPAASAPWTFAAVHVRPAGDREAQIQVLDIVTPDTFGAHTVTVGLDIQIPDGLFVDVESS